MSEDRDWYNIKAICICGWVGSDFEAHHAETIEDDQSHVETSKMMNDILGL